ncbi:MAG: HEAT repeat domain-containing protein [Planctomycetota bacterium]|nr:HEAT repeat domain-containing protein [Planctomycetota bacterium]
MKWLMIRSVMLSLTLTSMVLHGSVSSVLADGIMQLKKGDHVVFIGGTLAEREQYFGHIEAQIHALHPELNISVRDQGFTADEVRFRPRSLDFGEPDKHLTLARADVIFAFFGFAESFNGEAGLATFEQELRDFIAHSAKQNYSGKGAPRVVLFSPIAHENINNSNLPDGSVTNPNLELYTKAMSKVCSETKTPFVDLFSLSLSLYETNKSPLTFNGIHLSDDGYKVFAPAFVKAVFGKSAAGTSISPELMAEIAEKDFQYFHRYRAVNGFYIYGGRSQRDNGNPPFTDAYVLENERGKLDEMCAVVDQRIWAAVQGKPMAGPVDYSGTRQLYDVPTNFKDPINILPPEEAIKQFTVAKGYEINLFASEVDFPDLENPVNFTFDAKGRLWVATMPSYPQYQPPNKPNDKLLIFEDTDGDGKADKQSVFADGLHLPTGFEVGDGGAYVAQEPNLVHLIDTDDDGVADERKIVMGGFDSGDSHHAIGAFVWGPGGGVYMHEGTFHITQVETPYGPTRNGHGAVYRFDPTRQKLETFVSYNFANPWGHCWDRWGQNFVADASGGANYFGTAFSLRTQNFAGQDDFGPFKFVYRKQMEQFFKKRVRPTAGCEIVSSRHFPPEAQGNYLLNNCIGFQGVLQHTVKEEGSGFAGEEIEPILFSADRNFRPTDLQFGPDGALYIVDWFNPLVGHMQHNLRDPNRDHTHGRIWRITYPGRPLLKNQDLTKLSIPELLEQLKSPEDRVRHRTRIRLREFPADDVVAAVRRWFQVGLNENDKDYEHHLLEALWVCQHHNTAANSDAEIREFSRALLENRMQCEEARARAAAVRVLSHWRDLFPEKDVIAWLQEAANDDHPRVRLEAIRACSWVNTAVAAEVALEVVKHPRDYYIDYALEETIRGLEPLWKTSISSGHPFAASNPAGVEYILGSIPTVDLEKLPKSAPVLLAMLTRPAVKEQARLEALSGLATVKKSDELAELTSAINYVDRTDAAGAAQVIYDLVLMLTKRDPAELVKSRDQFETWTRSARRVITRRIGYVALIAVDQSVDPAWKLASQSLESLKDFLDAVSIIPDPAQRGALYDEVEPLLHGLPKKFAAQAAEANGTSGRYVRIEVPGRRRTLTLAEVEVFSGGRNIARAGKATQVNVSSGGDASRAIDGNKSGAYKDGGQTHTSDNTNNPWWEVDLGKEVPVESIVIWNRSESGGQYADRLDGFSLIVLNSKRKPVFQKKDNKASVESVRFELESDPAPRIRRAAINAITSIPGHEAETFTTLAEFAQKNDLRVSAVQGLQRIPRYRWPQDAAAVRPLVLTLVKYAREVDAAERATVAVRTSLQLANDLATILPADEARELRAAIGDLGVRIITIRTVPHRMRYDRPEIVVQAGKPIEIVLENTDIMPHNLLVTTPGKMLDVAQAAERMATSPDAFARGFVPDSSDVLFTTKLLQAGETERLLVEVPSQPGDYPYVCTFPGHWRTMAGVMHVVNDVDAYLAKNPIAEPTEIGEVRPFVRDWKFEELSEQVASMKSRSFANGKQLFTTVACFACHQMNEIGGRVGPDLAKLEAKKDRLHILRSMIEPSKEIDKKFEGWIVVTDIGKQFTGMKIAEDDTSVTLMPNPLGLENCEPIVIRKDEIDIIQVSPISLMPAKLLNTMSLEEVLDVIAYIESKGNPDHALFK